MRLISPAYVCKELHVQSGTIECCFIPSKKILNVPLETITEIHESQNTCQRCLGLTQLNVKVVGGSLLVSLFLVSYDLSCFWKNSSANCYLDSGFPVAHVFCTAKPHEYRELILATRDGEGPGINEMKC